MTKNKRVKKQRSFRTKLMIPVLLVIGVIFVVLLFVSLKFYENSFKNQEISNQQQQINRIAANISSLQLSVENITKKLAVNDLVQSQDTISTPSADYFVLENNINNQLRMYGYIIDDIVEVMIYTKEGRVYSSASNRGSFLPEEEQWYLDFKELKLQKGYTEVYSTSVKQDSSTNQVISYVLTYYSLVNHKEEQGDLIISINYDDLVESTELEMDMLNGYRIYNVRGNEVLGKGEMSISSDEIKKQLYDISTGQWNDQHGNIYVYSQDMRDGWFIVAEISANQMYKKLLNIFWILLCIFVLLIATVSSVISYRINKVIEPVERLSEAARVIGQGNFEVMVDVQTGDEIQLLAEGFNHMASNVRNYMKKSIELEKIRRRTEVDQLLLQINPHFIYNTLNSIVYMARIGGNRDVEEFTKAFVLLLQSTLHIKGGIHIRLEDEMKNVQNYLILQKFRYRNQFKEHIECEPELLECYVPKVILQPLVENAIFHGISPSDKVNTLIIQVKKVEDNLHIIIRDNGVGMTQETIEKMLSCDVEQKSGGMRKIGVANVENRIKEIYGDAYGITIESEVDRGTEILIKLPIKEEVESK